MKIARSTLCFIYLIMLFRSEDINVTTNTAPDETDSISNHTAVHELPTMNTTLAAVLNGTIIHGIPNTTATETTSNNTLFALDNNYSVTSGNVTLSELSATETLDVTTPLSHATTKENSITINEVTGNITRFVANIISPASDSANDETDQTTVNDKSVSPFLSSSTSVQTTTEDERSFVLTRQEVLGGIIGGSVGLVILVGLIITIILICKRRHAAKHDVRNPVARDVIRNQYNGFKPGKHRMLFRQGTPAKVRLLNGSGTYATRGIANGGFTSSLKRQRTKERKSSLSTIPEESSCPGSVNSQNDRFSITSSLNGMLQIHAVADDDDVFEDMKAANKNNDNKMCNNSAVTVNGKISNTSKDFQILIVERMEHQYNDESHAIEIIPLVTIKNQNKPLSTSNSTETNYMNESNILSDTVIDIDMTQQIEHTLEQSDQDQSFNNTDRDTNDSDAANSSDCEADYIDFDSARMRNIYLYPTPGDWSPSELRKVNEEWAQEQQELTMNQENVPQRYNRMQLEQDIMRRNLTKCMSCSCEGGQRLRELTAIYGTNQDCDRRLVSTGENIIGSFESNFVRHNFVTSNTDRDLLQVPKNNNHCIRYKTPPIETSTVNCMCQSADDDFSNTTVVVNSTSVKKNPVITNLHRSKSLPNSFERLQLLLTNMTQLQPENTYNSLELKSKKEKEAANERIKQNTLPRVKKLKLTSSQHNFPNGSVQQHISPTESHITESEVNGNDKICIDTNSHSEITETLGASGESSILDHLTSKTCTYNDHALETGAWANGTDDTIFNINNNELSDPTDECETYKYIKTDETVPPPVNACQGDGGSPQCKIHDDTYIDKIFIRYQAATENRRFSVDVYPQVEIGSVRKFLRH